MKINTNFRLLNKEVQLPANQTVQQTGEQSFSDFMQQQEEKSSREQLERMLQQVQEQGERLLKSMSIRELRAYKRSVQQFLEETARRGIGLKDTFGMDRRGRTKKYKILEEIDQHLLRLADDLLLQEEGRVDILQSIGEIKGLLINYLY